MQKRFIRNYGVKTLVKRICCLSIIITSLVFSPQVFAEISSAGSVANVKVSATAKRLVNMPAFKDSISKTFTASVNAQSEALLQNFPCSSAAFAKDFAATINDAVSYDNIKQDLAQLHSKYFSEPELKAILKFYNSAAGKKYLKVTPNLATDLGAVITKKTTDVAPKIQELAYKYINPDGSCKQ